MREGEIVSEETRDEQTGPQRVVLRGVAVLVLDDLVDDEARQALLATWDAPVVEAWVAVASRPGTTDAAIASYAGRSGAPDAKPGTYKAPPATSWFVPPQVIEPPLP